MTYNTYLKEIYNLLLKTIVSNSIKTRYRDNDIALFIHCKIISVYNKVKFFILTESSCVHYLSVHLRPKSLRPSIFELLNELPVCIQDSSVKET